MQPPIQMANLGMADSLILMVMALVVFGPRRLPQIGRQIGKLMYEFRKASNDFKFQMEEELRTSEDADRRKAEEERQRAAMLAAAAKPMLPGTPDSATAAAPVLATPPSPELASMPLTVTDNPHPDPAPATRLEATIAESAAEESLPRIMPPSIGEQVPAARPFNAAAAGEPATAEPEQAAHNA